MRFASTIASTGYAYAALAGISASIYLMVMSPRWAERVTMSYSRRQAIKLDGWESPIYDWSGPQNRAAPSPSRLEADDYEEVGGAHRESAGVPRRKPLVSIVTPSYNQAPFLEATLASVANQRYPRVEHIVMDGGSTDGSVEILEAWARSHTIRWRSGPDGGQAAALQAGVELATGEIVAWLNSDDVYLDDTVISDVVRAMASGADAVSGAGWYITPSGERLRHIPVFSDRLTFASLRHVDWVLQPSTFVRREVFLKFPLDTRLHFAFDWDFFIRLSRTVRLVPLGRDIAGYRLHGTGKTETGGARRRQELLEVTRRYNGRWAPGMLILMAVTALEALGQRFPSPLRFATRGIATRIALLSNLVTNGRGIQY